MADLKQCPNCGSDIKSGILSSNDILESKGIQVINEYNTTKSEAYCEKCGNDLLKSCKRAMEDEMKGIERRISTLIKKIPVITLHSPKDWDYDVIGIMTGQSTTGTGVITEFTSILSDALGAQSGRHNEKLKQGEILCLNQLRFQTLLAGGNAVIGTDIDYSEVGSLKGMLMVCAAGTAIKLKNLEILGPELGTEIDELIKIHKRILYLETFKLE